ncbi:AbrB/MazE/SpoVT family DNA-binding domain-containing protein [Candidatus Woesearchaeota archaeon]|nr:AbrB/MazE/SpoVT family DNA-binding domain-containing protein [Candidatus Woesearchaeota archaeon]
MIIEKYVKIGERGQIVIPKEIREKEHIKPEDRLRLINIEREIIIKIDKHEKQPELRALEILNEAKLTEKDWQEILRMRQKE